MASLKAIRLRIKSIKSTQKITKAMQMVSASKLRRAKDAMDNNMTYTGLIADTMRQLPRDSEYPTKLEKLVIGSDSKKPSKVLAIVMTSERGLCGGFNGSILRYARTEINNMKAEGIDVKVITIGKKGSGMMAQLYDKDVIAHFANPQHIDEISVKVIDKEIKKQIDGDFDACKIYFNHFKNAIVQVPTTRDIVPSVATENNVTRSSYEYEGESLADSVINMYISAEIYHSLLESRASEEAARMVAMDNATKNAGDMIGRLTLSMNRSRQAMITKELIEIISGAEAV